MNNAQIYLCQKEIVNKFPNKSDIYLCGEEKPITCWITCNHIYPGQPLIVSKDHQDLSIYLYQKDKLIQISGVKDLIHTTNIQNSKTQGWYGMVEYAKEILNILYQAHDNDFLLHTFLEISEFENKLIENILSNNLNDSEKINSLFFQMLEGSLFKNDVVIPSIQIDLSVKYQLSSTSPV